MPKDQALPKPDGDLVSFGLIDVAAAVNAARLRIGLAVVLGALTGLVGHAVLPTTFTAEALLVLDPAASVDVLGVRAAPLPTATLVATEKDVILSRAVVRSAESRARDFRPDPSAADSAAAPATASSDEPAHPATGASHAPPKAQVGWSPFLAAPVEDDIDAVLDALQGNLSVASEDDSLALAVSFRSDSPEYSAAFVNALLQSYIDHGIEQDSFERERLISQTTERLAAIEQRLDSLDVEISAFLERPDGHNAASRARELADGLQEVHRNLTFDVERTRATPIRARARIAARAEPPRRPSSPARAVLVAGGGVLAGLLAALFAVFVAQYTRSMEATARSNDADE